MAKKTKKKKKGSPMKRYAGKGTAARTVKRARGARSQVLPGMEQVRDVKLDNLCEAIGQVRATANEAKQEEAGLIASTLQRMVAKDVSVYRHAGVELARVPGAEKLRVRLTKETGDATGDDLEVGEGDGGDKDAGGGAYVGNEGMESTDQGVH